MNGPIKDGGPAFPCDMVDFQPETGTQVVREQYCGMSLRDYFAAKLAAGMVSPEQPQDTETVARVAYEIADAMIARRYIQ